MGGWWISRFVARRESMADLAEARQPSCEPLPGRVYAAQEGRIKIDVRLEGGIVWPNAVVLYVDRS